jgi:hypothetical protein
MSSLKIEILADNETDLIRLVGTLSRLLPGHGAGIVAPSLGVEAITNDDGETVAYIAETEVEPVAEEKPKRGRKPKVTDIDVTDQESAPSETDPPAAESSPKEAMETAMATLRMVFARGSKGAKLVQEIRAKYAVKKFDEVPLERAHELLADATAADAETKEMVPA